MSEDENPPEVDRMLLKIASERSTSERLTADLPAEQDHDDDPKQQQKEEMERGVEGHDEENPSEVSRMLLKIVRERSTGYLPVEDDHGGDYQQQQEEERKRRRERQEGNSVSRPSEDAGAASFEGTLAWQRNGQLPLNCNTDILKGGRLRDYIMDDSSSTENRDWQDVVDSPDDTELPVATQVVVTTPEALSDSDVISILQVLENADHPTVREILKQRSSHLGIAEPISPSSIAQPSQPFLDEQAKTWIQRGFVMVLVLILAVVFFIWMPQST